MVVTSAPVLRAFLISDIRGYSTFAHQRGDEATSQLAQRFQDIASHVLPAHGGHILGRRGDEVLAAFDSARAAVRAAVAFQKALLEATRADPSLPLPAGLGMDFGEAVVVNGEWSANAINVAARLCSLAHGGEVLATEELRHIAQAVDDVRYVERSPVTVKGVTRPVRHVRVVATNLDTAAAFRSLGLTQAAVAPAPKRRRLRRRALAIAAMAIAAFAATAVALTVGTDSGSSVPRLSADTVSALSLDGTTKRRAIEIGGAPGPIAVDGKAAWVLNASTNTVARVDVADVGAPANVIQVGHNPSAVAVGHGATWVANSGDKSVSRIDPGVPPSVGDTISVGNAPSAVAAGFRLIWVANQIDDTVTVIDPTARNGLPADRVVATISVGGGPDAIVAGFGKVWVADAGTSTVSVIDPSTLVTTAQIAVGNSPRAIGADSAGIWVANTLDSTVSHINPHTDSVAATIGVPAQPTALGVDDHHVWVASATDLSDVDPSADRVARTLTVPVGPTGVTVGADRLWVDTGGSATTHTGGTLTIVQGGKGVGYAPTFDPAVAYSPFGWSILAATNDGLLTFQHTGGADGALIVPDLAARLPQVSDSGRTYTFQLRRGIRYSTGAVVHPSDFRTSMERVLRLAKAPPYYTHIVGAVGCAAKPTTCSLARGIVADDASGTITIHLTTADPDLEDELALPFADVLPAGTPERDLGLGPHPATGAYAIIRRSGSTTLVTRNKYFHQWSAAAQPTGYVDSVAITTATSSTTANIDAVARGNFDWTPDLVSGSQLTNLVRTRTTQLHADPDNSVHYIYLNTRDAPFTDVRVRRAVNLAVDRHAAVADFGGPLVAAVTCQLIAPSLYGYGPYCPYTTHSSQTSGTWNGADLAAARTLVRQAHVTGAKVTVVVPPDHAAIGRLIAGDMRAIGLDAIASTYPSSDTYYDYIGDQAHHVQAALEGWVVDYPEPSNLFEPLLECADRTPTGNLDESLFCDPSVDRAIAAALAEQSTDPASARLAWAAVDKQIDDESPWVPLVNGREYNIVSPRVANYQHHPEYGMLIDQAWVK